MVHAPEHLALAGADQLERLGQRLRIAARELLSIDGAPRTRADRPRRFAGGDALLVRDDVCRPQLGFVAWAESAEADLVCLERGLGRY